MVGSIPRGPAKAGRAPGAASRRSPGLAKVAVTPPGVGWVGRAAVLDLAVAGRVPAAALAECPAGSVPAAAVPGRVAVPGAAAGSAPRAVGAAASVPAAVPPAAAVPGADNPFAR